MNPKASPPTEVICFVMDGSSRISCPSTPLRRRFFALYSNPIPGQQDSLPSSLLPDFNKLSRLSHFKYTKKVKPWLHPPAPARLCYCTLCIRRQAEQMGRSAARQTLSKQYFPAIQRAESLHCCRSLLLFSGGGGAAQLPYQLNSMCHFHCSLCSCYECWNIWYVQILLKRLSVLTWEIIRSKHSLQESQMWPK